MFTIERDQEEEKLQWQLKYHHKARKDCGEVVMKVI